MWKDNYVSDQNPKKYNVENMNYSQLIYLSNNRIDWELPGKHVVFPKNHIIMHEGDYTEFCYIIKTGRVVSYETYLNGNERIYHMYEKGSLFLEDNLLFNRASQISFRTVIPTELICITKECLLKKMQDNLQVALDILDLSSAKYQSSIMQMRNEKNHCVTWKVCDLLLSLAEHLGDTIEEKIVIKEKFSQQLIADLVGSNRVTVARSMKELKDAGLIERFNGSYCINNKKQLEEYKNFLGNRCEKVSLLTIDKFANLD